MATSGLYSFNPSNADLVTAAFRRIGIRPVDLTQDHMTDGRTEMNLWLASASNRGPNLWAVDLVTTPLVAGTRTYNVDGNTVMILDAFLESSGLSTTITPFSRSDYAAIGNKDTEGRPTSFWFDRLVSPTVTLWPVPDQVYSLKYYRYRRLQDAELPSGETADVPYLFLDALVAGVAHRLARIWAPNLEGARKADADEAWNIASTQNTENVPMQITPLLGGYFR